MVAVLPFDNLSNDPEQEYFADGIAEELITILAHISRVSVIARNSTFTYKGKAVDVRTVGKEMGAEYVLEGSVRRSADRVRVTAQLLSSRDGSHLWSEKYESDLNAADLFELQDEIANKVATAVGGSHGVIVLSKTREISRKPPELLRSYDCVLKALEFARTLSSESYDAARDCLERTVAEDPEYSEGWARLVNIYLNEYALGFNPKPEPLARAERALRKALALDPSSALARSQEAFLLYLRKDPLFISKALRWAETYPNDGHGLMSLGSWLCWAERWEDGFRLLERSKRFNLVLPGWAHFPVADWHMRNREFEKALESILRSEMHGLFWYHSRLARAYAHLGRMKEAHEQVAILRKIRPDYERFAAAESRKWMWNNDAIDVQMTGLRKAGLNIPSDSGES